MRILLVLITTILFGCSKNTPLEPPSAIEDSTQRSQLEERISFLEQYVKFDRNYKKLEYDISYYNGGGGLIPGPSEWDIKILAKVPANEIDEWIPPEVKSNNKKPPQWLTEMPGNISTKNITEWYKSGSAEIGIDRNTSTVAYRNTTLW